MKATGENKGNISAYKNGKKPIPDNFLTTLYKHFGDPGPEKPKDPAEAGEKKPGSVGYQADELAEAKAEAKEANAAIRGYNAWMQRMMEFNFSALLSKQEGEIGIVIEILKLGARLESAGNPDKEREILADSLRRIGQDLSPKMKEDIARDGRT